MADCVKHVSCPTCYKSAESYQFFYDEDSGDEFEETEPEKHTYLKSYHCWEEQYMCTRQTRSCNRPLSGYVKCWICEKNLCSLHFEKHYGTCRREAMKRCGFRPPTPENDGKGHVCVPGHCGKVITKEEKRYVCYPDDGMCCTVSCKNCITICQNEVEGHNIYSYQWRICGQARCKLCRQECFGECWG